MHQDVPAADWKVFREVRVAALDRFCQRVLQGLDRFQQEGTGRSHERYLALYRWIQDQDKELARAFNDPRRSDMLRPLRAIHELGVLTPDELARFSPSTRQDIESRSSK